MGSFIDRPIPLASAAVFPSLALPEGEVVPHRRDDKEFSPSVHEGLEHARGSARRLPRISPQYVRDRDALRIQASTSISRDVGEPSERRSGGKGEMGTFFSRLSIGRYRRLSYERR
jgi:hypothetical protein